MEHTNVNICPNCGAEIPSGQYYCPACGVSADGNYIVEKEIIYYDKLKETLIRIGGLYGWQKKKNNPLQPYKNIRYQLTDTCPHCGRTVGDKEFYCKVCAEPIPIIKYTVKKYKKPKTRRQIIRQQFKQDKTSICPRCGSHSVTVYPKGYNWGEAFWGSMLDIKESVFTAGMDANEAMCQCQNCGAKWNTHYDIRKL